VAGKKNAAGACRDDWLAQKGKVNSAAVGVQQKARACRRFSARLRFARLYSAPALRAAFQLPSTKDRALGLKSEAA
jgi:hypothetical protein